METGGDLVSQSAMTYLFGEVLSSYASEPIKLLRIGRQLGSSLSHLLTRDLLFHNLEFQEAASFFLRQRLWPFMFGKEPHIVLSAHEARVEISHTDIELISSISGAQEQDAQAAALIDGFLEFQSGLFQAFFAALGWRVKTRCKRSTDTLNVSRIILQRVGAMEGAPNPQ
eukprot:gnl/Chilomastix_cuspidata/3496.p2 GENE.gnl/Chilomastix_cuspidata/3496~~gnl/Chilomastix_cuspidata/3496.p2  ORF type:complete len:170 (+),score=52.27 gnl/Chilomastix_cuspidata/3496:1073-1582(+)